MIVSDLSHLPSQDDKQRHDVVVYSYALDVLATLAKTMFVVEVSQRDSVM